jgi:hypothetical protein
MQFSLQKLVKKKELEKIKEQRSILWKQMVELDIQADEIKMFINNKQTKIRIQYTHKCIDKSCSGYLNAQFKCDLCNIDFCNKCFTKKEETHECDPELVETCKLIKSESKPCPKCGEYISKISGCDQMFCNMPNCGTAFSWTSGIIERGIIHNPHAHAFFQNNPDALNDYMNMNNNNNNNCRNPIPPYQKYSDVRKKLLFNNIILKKFEDLYRYTSEFRQYRRDEFINYIDNNDNQNEDIRMDILNKEMISANITNDLNTIKQKEKEKEENEKKFISLISARHKKRNLKKYVYQIIIPTYEIFENYIWNIVNINKENEEFINDVFKIFEILEKVMNDTNRTIQNIYLENGYGAKSLFCTNFTILTI